jgi:hypothetical protein
MRYILGTTPPYGQIHKTHYIKSMADMFSVNKRDLKRLEKFARNAPKKFTRAANWVLNSQAFQAKKNYYTEISNTMEIRSPGFVKSSLRVQTAKSSLPLANMVAIAGSINRDRFSGWKEQEKGTSPPSDKRTPTIQARGNSKSSRVLPRYRMKQGRKFIRPNTMPGRNFAFKMRTFFRVSSQRKKNVLFYLDRKYKKMKPGLYFLNRGKKMDKIQSTDRPEKPRRNKWMTRGNNKIRRSDVRKWWIEGIKKQGIK